jgi:hypothetical protein
MVGWQQVELALPKRNPLTRLKKLRLRDLTDAPFIWFPRRASPAFYDQLMHECYRGGLKSPRIVQEGPNEATILSLVSLSQHRRRTAIRTSSSARKSWDYRSTLTL